MINVLPQSYARPSSIILLNEKWVRESSSASFENTDERSNRR